MSVDSHLAPVGDTERIQTLDLLRGVALPGILIINIEFFALPSSTFTDPRLAGGFASGFLIPTQRPTVATGTTRTN